MRLVSGDRGSVVIAGAVARRPDRAGHAWVFLQYILGFRRLGWDVLWLDSIDEPGERESASASIRAFDELVAYAGAGVDAALLVDATEPAAGRATVRGLDRSTVLERVREADLFINVMGYVRDEEILAAAARLLFLDIDPGFGQMWEDLGLAHLFHGHDAYATVGERLGSADCRIPTLGIDWIPTPPPVVLDRFAGPAEDAPPDAPGLLGSRWTSIASWRGPFEPIEHGGQSYGLRAHEFRRFIDLPHRTGTDFGLALDIDEADRDDRDALEAAGWLLSDPLDVAARLDDYRRLIRESRGEIMIAKGLYVKTRSGWFSDRSTCYLASGRPVVAQDTGWSERYPTGRGLLRFDEPDEAAAAIAAVERAPGPHARAAREMAEAFFDSDRVLTRLVERATARPAAVGRPPASQYATHEAP